MMRNILRISSIRLALIALSSAFLPASAMAQQFNLNCGFGEIGDGDILEARSPIYLQIDFASQQWCFNSCNKIEKIDAVSGSEVVLSSDARHLYLYRVEGEMIYIPHTNQLVYRTTVWSDGKQAEYRVVHPCEKDEFGMFEPSQAAPARINQSRLARLFQSEDGRKVSMLAPRGEVVTVAIKLEIDPEGSISGCEAYGATRREVLEAATCGFIISADLDSQAARDRHGNPVAGAYRQVIKFANFDD